MVLAPIDAVDEPSALLTNNGPVFAIAVFPIRFDACPTQNRRAWSSARYIVTPSTVEIAGRSTSDAGIVSWARSTGT